MAGTLYDRIRRAGPIGRLLAPVFEEMIEKVNSALETVRGTAPHITNDVTNVLTLGIAGAILDEIVDLEQEIIIQYEAHIASTSHHVGADSTNGVTEIGVPLEVYALLDELKVDYEAHRILTGGSVHAGTDAVNVITAANATTKALAVLLANDLSAIMQVNFANISTHHGLSDTAGIAALLALGVLDGDSTWAEIAAVADGIRVNYEAHRVLTAGSVHGGVDSTNTVTAAAVGAVQTAVNTGLDELKADFNAHIVEPTGAWHYVVDNSMKVIAAASTSLATSRTLVNALRVSFSDHITKADEPAEAILPLASRTE